jgi:hypothetical protein
MDASTNTRTPCTIPFLLCQLEVGRTDKLGNTIEQIWSRGPEYAVYQTNEGVHVHFSDCPEMEKDQRKRFIEICAELCELRYLTAQMRARNGWWRSPRRQATTVPRPSAEKTTTTVADASATETASKIRPLSKSNDRGVSLYEHNMAQAVMLLMEGETERAKRLARQTLDMAVRQVTTDNTIRYARVCLIAAFIWILISLVLLLALWWFDAAAVNWAANLRGYVVASMFGAAGAVFSIATRLTDFKLRPCDDSRMNKWISAIRVGMGAVAAIVLLLLANTLLRDATPIRLLLAGPKGESVLWEVAAMLGFLGGFTERLIPTLLRQTVTTIESPDGTPVQAVRRRATAPQRDDE